MWDFFIWVVWERECENSRQIKDQVSFRKKTSREMKPCAQHMIGMRRVMTDGGNWFSLVFRR